MINELIFAKQTTNHELAKKCEKHDRMIMNGMNDPKNRAF